MAPIGDASPMGAFKRRAREEVHGVAEDIERQQRRPRIEAQACPCVLVEGLPDSWEEFEVQKVFADFGVSSVRFRTESTASTGRAALVKLRTPGVAQNAAALLDGAEVSEGNGSGRCTLRCSVQWRLNVRLAASGRLLAAVDAETAWTLRRLRAELSQYLPPGALLNQLVKGGRILGSTATGDDETLQEAGLVGADEVQVLLGAAPPPVASAPSPSWMLQQVARPLLGRARARRHPLQPAVAHPIPVAWPDAGGWQPSDALARLGA